MKKVKDLPQKAGVYIFKDKSGKIIYIGKALSLKHRVASYFDKAAKESKTQLLASQIADIDYLLVESEFQALLLEARLIKQHRPKFNVQLKDDKRYLYIAIYKSPFPHINIVRRPDLDKNIFDWFGPFPSSSTTKQVLRSLRRIFPFCTCRFLPRRQCLYYHLNLCPGLTNLQSQQHRNNINKVRKILSGQSKQLIKSLTKEMKKAAKSLLFERAQKYKEQILAFERITQGWQSLTKQSINISKALLQIRKILVRYQGPEPFLLNKIEGFDVSNLGKNIVVGSMVTFVNGEAEKRLYRKFKIRQTYQNDPAGIREIVFRRLNHPEWLYPQLILVDGGKTQVSAAFAALKKKKLENQIAILGLAKREEVIVVPRIKKGKISDWKILKLSFRSPSLQLLEQIRDESHRFAQKYYQQLHQKTIK